MGDIVRADANGRENIWLRQSVTFTVDGQTRTLEIGIPLPSGATPDDVEALLNEADAGMVRLSHYLDERVAAQLGAPLPPATPVSMPRQTVTEQPPTPASVEEPLPELADETPELPASAAPAIEASVADAASAPTSAPTREPQHDVAPVAQAQPIPPARSAPRAASPTPPPAQPANTSGPRHPKPAAPAVTGPDMTRPQFIGALGELGLNPKQAMDRLNVRSLEGLNLREALEALRRQLAQETSGGSAPEPGVEPSAPESAPEPAVAAAAPRYFDEEDDPNLVFTVDAPDFEDEEEEFEAVATSPKTFDDEDDLDLDDVPDFPAAPVTAAASRTARKPASARAPEAEPATRMPSATSGSLQSASSPDRTRAMQLVGKLRSAQGGGPASDYQRKAYDNLVEGQLEAGQAAALVRGLWRIPVERLTSDQLDALVRWGKEDAFVDEAVLVIATLRAEQARAANANGAADAQEATTPPQRPRPVRGTGTSSARQGSAG